jgi:hypothetical protein
LGTLRYVNKKLDSQSARERNSDAASRRITRKNGRLADSCVEGTRLGRLAVTTSVIESSGSERRIALFKPASATDERMTHAMQLLDSVLWAFQGTTRSIWKVTDPEVAHVVVVYTEDYDPRIEGWRNSGKVVVEIATEGLADPAVQNRLVYPFRAQQVLVLLERLDAQLDPHAGPVAPPDAGQSAVPTDPWSFVEALRTLRSVANSETWLVGRTGRAPVLWLRGDAVSYSTDSATVQAIRRGTLSLSSVSLQKGTDPANGPTQRSGMELSWFAGYYASPTLAPSLKAAGVRYRINQWPNFGLIRPLPAQLRVAAGLSSAAADLEEIITRAKVTAEEAIRTLNALYACDVLIAVELSEIAAPAVAASSVTRPRGGFTDFLRNVRKHLGLGV